MKLKISILICLLAISIGAYSAKAEERRDGNRIDIERETRGGQRDLKNEREGNLKNLRASTTGVLRDLKERFRDEREDLKASTTITKREIKVLRTDLFREYKNIRREIKNRIHRDEFQIRKDFLVRKLNLTLENLRNIRSRISERITTAEAGGRNMTEAKASLVIADDKLVKARVAVDLFATFTYPTATSTGTTTTEVELERPRKMGDEAIRAVKIARNALKDVVKAIAHNMGLGENKKNKDDDDDNATTTATTTPPTATTTATTTTN